jgi:hypothetical protein
MAKSVEELKKAIEKAQKIQESVKQTVDKLKAEEAARQEKLKAEEQLKAPTRPLA